MIGADTLFFDPELVRLLRGIATYIDSITISCNISRYASASRIEANNAVVFPPEQESRMVAELPEQAAAVGWAAYFEAAGHLVHFHRLLDHQVAKEALPRR